MPNQSTTEGSLRFGTASLLLATLNVSLFLGAVMWCVRGPDAGVAELMAAAADGLRASGEVNSLTGIAIVSPVVFLGGLIAAVITTLRMRRFSWSLCHLIGFGTAAAIASAIWLTDIAGNQAPQVAGRLALPLATAAVAMVVEVAYRRLPSPYWVLAGMGLFVGASYLAFVLAAWASGGRY